MGLAVLLLSSGFLFGQMGQPLPGQPTVKGNLPP